MEKTTDMILALIVILWFSLVSIVAGWFLFDKVSAFRTADLVKNVNTVLTAQERNVDAKLKLLGQRIEVVAAQSKMAAQPVPETKKK